MAAFTDQFERHDPQTFDASDLFNGWRRQVAWECRQLLRDRSPQELTVIARGIDRMATTQAAVQIDRESQHSPTAHFVRVLWELDGGRPQSKRTHGLRPRTLTPENIVRVRENDGDLNLYLEAGGFAALGSEPEMRAMAVTEWDALATISLWKLIDHSDLVRSTIPLDRRGQFTHRLPTGTAKIDFLKAGQRKLRTAAADAMEAAIACTAATEAHRRNQILALTTAGGEQLAERARALEHAAEARLTKARNASRLANAARWSVVADHKKKAIELAASRPFKSRAKAAEYVLQEIVKREEETETYTFDTVDRWLREAGYPFKK